MGQQIKFFEKNKADFDNTVMSVTASEGDDFSLLALNRSNKDAWITTGSTDASNTTYIIDFVDLKDINTILLIKHNFLDFTLETWNGLSYDLQATVSGNAAETTEHSFADVETSRVRLTITATIVADDEKVLRQFIVTDQLGQFEGWPLIKSPEHSRARKKSRLLSGKVSVRENEGGFRCKLDVRHWNIPSDLAIVEALYASNDGFLVWLCGGDETQFGMIREGYRLEDLPLMKCVNEYRPEWVKGIYTLGMKIKIDLHEIS